MIEIMKHAWHVKFQSSAERGSNYTRWDIQAVNPTDKMFYTVDGDSIAEAVDKWFIRTERIQEKPSTLYQAKEAEAEIIIEEAQFYG